MTTYIITAAYIIGWLCFARWFIWYNAYKFPSLPWSGSDTFWLMWFSTLWPFAALVFGGGWLLSKLPSGPFARIHENDLKRRK